MQTEGGTGARGSSLVFCLLQANYLYKFLEAYEMGGETREHEGQGAENISNQVKEGDHGR
jgi:hypothetical protein